MTPKNFKGVAENDIESIFIDLENDFEFTVIGGE